MSDTLPGDLGGRPTRSRIAAIQDATYPDAENLASHRELTIPVRTGYRRHDFAGLNVFLLELTRQFDDVLGVRRTDFMTGSQRDLPDAIGGMVTRAESQTARIAVAAIAGEGEVTADVRVENLAGHRFPTGVGFRRAFLEVSLVERRRPGRLDQRGDGRDGHARGAGRRPAADGVFRAGRRRRPAVPAAPRRHRFDDAGPGLRNAAEEPRRAVHDELRARLRDGEGQPPAAPRLVVTPAPRRNWTGRT